MFSQYLEEYAQKKYQSREHYLAPIREKIEHHLAACTQEEALLMRFLYGTMPVRDAGEYDFSVFYSYVRHALWLREHVTWCRELPEDIFVHHVLYYRINSEDISDCRAFFYEQLKERITGLDMEKAVMEVNYWCAEHAVYESTDSRTASPMTMYRCKKGRCGEESTFAVTAFRSVGIPARQVYTPRWAHCDDNHAWVEVYIHGKWHFLGACEPEAVLDKGWFSGPASRAILIHSRTFSDFVSNRSEECIGREDLLVYYNHTNAYAKTGELTITVRNRDHKSVGGASVAIDILNMAEYFPAATLLTDEWGKVRITIGLGDIRIRAWKGRYFAEQTVSPQQSLNAELTLTQCEEEPDWIADEWIGLELKAPEEYQMHPGKETAEQKAQNEKRITEAAVMRETSLQACWHENFAADFPEENQMLHIAGQNFMELYTFLSKDGNPDRKRMLHSLVPKDYKDLKADILENHLDCERGGCSEEIYVNWLLCPRIYLEELTPYRSFIREYFTEEEKKAFQEDPDRIWQYIRDHIKYIPEVDYQTICATPMGCLKLKQGNELAQKILFVAICRSLSIPARLDRIRLCPEYFRRDAFVIPQSLQVEEGTGVKKEPASLTLIAEDGSKWKYYQNYTIGKLQGVHYQTLDYEGIKFQEDRLKFDLEPGIYRLITALRMPDGGQHVSERVFCLNSFEKKELEVSLWEAKVEDMLVHIPLPNQEVSNESGNLCRISNTVSEKPVILAFLGVGQEPTEHVLNELLECAETWNKTEEQIQLILKSADDLENATLKKVRGTVSGIGVFFDQNGYDKIVASAMHVDSEKLPVLTVVDKDFAGIYACSGYNVGSVDLMLKILRRKAAAEQI